jgi:hypothetical protein
MSREVRRDNRRRILRTGESQNKEGRYVYKYINSLGEQKFIYSWKLVPTDRVPKGKRDDISLREKIAEVQTAELGNTKSRFQKYYKFVIILFVGSVAFCKCQQGFFLL